MGSFNFPGSERTQPSVSRAVLDKSFLEGCTACELAKIAESGYRFVVTMEHYVEVCTGAKQGLVRKLHSLSEHVDLLDHIGTLYKYEIENRRACSPVADRFIQGYLNPNFSFQFTDEQRTAIAAECEHIETWSSNVFEKIIQEVAIKSGGLEALDAACADTVRTVYGRLRLLNSGLPEPDLIDERWAIYRKVQMDLLATTDYLKAWNGRALSFRQERRRHDQVDFRICIVAALTGGLAARDKRLIGYFQAICPLGDLIT